MQWCNRQRVHLSFLTNNGIHYTAVYYCIATSLSGRAHALHAEDPKSSSWHSHVKEHTCWERPFSILVSGELLIVQVGNTELGGPMA